MSMCNGKCYLAEKLKKAQEKEEKQAPSGKKEKLEVSYYYTKSSFEGLSRCFDQLNHLNSEYLSVFHDTMLPEGIFRPPKINSLT